jgi:hypothetical protein
VSAGSTPPQNLDAVKGIVSEALARLRAARAAGRGAPVPAIVVRLPLEGRAAAHVEAMSWEDERRVALALDNPGGLLDLAAEALVELADAIDVEGST